MGMCYNDAGWQLPAKNSVFAITDKHALRLEKTFNRDVPRTPGIARSGNHIQYVTGQRFIMAFAREIYLQVCFARPHTLGIALVDCLIIPLDIRHQYTS
jgi:hypothetical protein